MGGTQTYEVTVTFLMEQPTDLLLSEDEIADNARMSVEDLGTIGHALITPGTTDAEVRKYDPEVD